MSLLFFISMVLLFVYIIIYVFDPVLSKKKEFNDITKRNDDIFVRKMFLMKQKSELELDLDIGNINLNEYKKEEVELNKKLNKLNLD